MAMIYFCPEMKKKNDSIVIDKDNQLQQRDFRITISLNEKEYNAVNRYMDKYKINNRNQIGRASCRERVYDLV